MSSIVPNHLLENLSILAEFGISSDEHDTGLRYVYRYKAFKFDADRDNLFSQMDEEKHQKMRQRVTAGVSNCPCTLVTFAYTEKHHSILVKIALDLKRTWTE